MVLKDHTRRKRKLVPPMLEALGNGYSPYSWAKELVPEFFWISKLMADYGPQTGVETARAFAEAARNSCTTEPKPMFATASSFSKLSQDEQELLVCNLPRHTRELVQNALNPIAAVWPASPFSFLSLETELSPREALQKISPLLRKLYDRHSRESTLTISTAVYLGLDQNKIRISAEIMEKRASAFKDIEEYPETEASRSAGSFFRAMAPMCLQMQKQDEGNESDLWQKSFWDGVSDLGECIGLLQELPELPSTTEGFDGFIAAYSHFVHKDLRERQKAWPIDLQKPQSQQVVLALLARQATLAIETISAPSTWSPNVGPVLMRAMADAHITLVWLLGDLEKRVPMYVNDGLGATKLEIAHREAELKQNPDKDTEEQRHYTEHLKEWLESQQMSDLTEVNLGSWSGKNTRVMADEANCKDFYNFVFQPFSAAVHSHWSHVGRLNVEPCQNPSHGYHFLPAIFTVQPDTHWCYLASKYLAKSLSAFDAFLGREDLEVKSFSVAVDAIEQFEAKRDD